MENKPNVWKEALNWGLIVGIISIILSVVLYVFDFKPINFTNMGILFLLSMIVSIVALVYAVKAYRNNVYGGFISFKDAFVFGLLVMIVASIISSFYSFIFFSYIDPDYLISVVEGTRQSIEEFMLNRGMSEDDVAKAMEKAAEEPIPTPLKSSLQSIISGSIFGAILSLIIAAIMKKKNEEVNFDDIE